MTALDHIHQNILLQSAKSRFDYAAFCAQFPFDPACLIVQLIVGLSGTDSYAMIAAFLHQTALDKGYQWPELAIHGFVQKMEYTLRREVAMASLANDMTEQGYPGEEILALAGQLCANSPLLAPAEQPAGI